MTITVYPPYGSTVNNAFYTQFGGSTVDAFGRLRVTSPYTLFDSQSRFLADPQYSFVVDPSLNGSTSYNSNKSSVNLTVNTVSGATVLAQTRRVFPYQPGKGLLTLQTFTMAAAKTNLVQRVGYYGAQNGVYLEQGPNGVTFVVRTYTSGSVDDTRFVAQANWNGDKLNGTGPSGVTLDLTKTQILWFDFEWLGVGNVRCGFVVNGQFIVCHTFQNANIGTNVYMQTAILPLRFEITNTAGTASSSTLQMICSSVQSEGGYEQTSQVFTARPTGNGVAIANATGLSFTPLVSIRVNSSYYGAIVIPDTILFHPTASGSTGYEIVLAKNATLTGATWAAPKLSANQVDVDVAATAMTATDDNIIQTSYAAQTSQGTSAAIVSAGYNFDIQIGYTASLTGNGFASSDTYTLGVRGLNNSPAGSGIGAISFYNLTV